MGPLAVAVETVMRSAGPSRASKAWGVMPDSHVGPTVDV